MDIKINTQMTKSQALDDFSGVNITLQMGGVK